MPGLHRLTLMHIWRIPAAMLFFWYGMRGELPPLFWIIAGVGDLFAGIYASTLLWREHTPDLYRRMLRSFIADLLRIPGRASSALDAGDVKTATRVMHTLKGLAATLGANALASVASISEAHLAANLAQMARNKEYATLDMEAESLANGYWQRLGVQNTSELTPDRVASPNSARHR